MDSLDLAIHQTAHSDLPLLAKQMGINEQGLRNKVCPTNTTAKLSVRELLSMMLITDDWSVLSVLAQEVGCKVVASEPMQSSSILGALLVFGKEQGDVSASIQSALSDGRISVREHGCINKEIEEAINALHLLKKSVQNQAGSLL